MDGDANSTTPIKLNPDAITPKIGTLAYTPELRGACDGREKRALGDTFGLSHFGVNHTVLNPGAASSLRHWHETEDEFIYVLSGELTLITDAGETLLHPGECAGFPAGRPNGHVVINKSAEPAIYLEVGTRADSDNVHYPDHDLHGIKAGGQYSFTRKDGSPT